MDTSRKIDTLRSELEKELMENILPYWSTKMVDNVNGGFYGRRDGFDRLEENADKAIILNTRILWTFSRAIKFSEEARPIADRAYHYLVEHFVDKEKGGVYWMLDYKGNPVSTKKQIYAQAFAIYALSEYHMATGDAISLELCRELFYLIEKHSFDQEFNGYLEAFDRDWNLLEDLRLSEKDANEKKTMNTHLHVLEAYTNLYRCWKDERLKKQLRNLVLVFRDKILSPQNHFNLFFDERWNVKSDEISYGHDIEGSWLLFEAVEVLGDIDLLEEITIISLKLVDVTLQEGFANDGGLKNEAHDPEKHWWPQAEALVGLINSWQLTNQYSYLASAFRVWDFIRDNLVDREHGEWFWRVDVNGNVVRAEDKAGPWKCPYHNGRAIFELLERLPVHYSATMKAHGY